MRRESMSWEWRGVIMGIIIIVLLLMSSCQSPDKMQLRELTPQEYTLFEFCKEWHGAYELEPPYISTEISKCKQSEWGCYISYGLIVIAPDVDSEPDLFGRVYHGDDSEVKGFIIAHEITHYILDYLSGGNIDPKHESVFFKSDSCILQSRDLEI